MSGNFSVIKEGSTLIGDHKTAVQALEDVLASVDVHTAKAVATVALKKIGEPGYDENSVKAEPCVGDMVTHEGRAIDEKMPWQK